MDARTDVNAGLKMQPGRSAPAGLDFCVSMCEPASVCYDMRLSFRGTSVTVALLVFIECGCSPWKAEKNDGPLNGPNSQSSTFVRKYLQPEGMMEKRAWSVRGNKVTVTSIAKDIDSYCATLPDYSKWTALQAFSEGKQLRFAPAKFWIVAVDPITVIMLPFTVEQPDSHSLQQLGGATDDRALVSGILANRYNFGTRFESASALQWFVVGNTRGLSTERFDGKQLTLTNGDMVLVLTKGKDGVTDVKRIAR
jgi:hypothetical protein